MRILFITPYLPSLIRVRPYNFVKALAGRGHQVSVLCLVQPQTNPDSVDDLRWYCENVQTVRQGRIRPVLEALVHVPGSAPVQVAYCFSKLMCDKVKQALSDNRFDVVHVEHIRAAHFLGQAGVIPSVFDSVDCITSLYEQFSHDKPSLFGRWISEIEYRKLRSYEPRAAGKFQRVIVTSRKDKEDLENLDPNLRVDVISNGVDTKYFCPSKGLGDGGKIVFSGKMSYYANESAAALVSKQVMPRIRAREPKATLTLVGSCPSRRVRRYALQDGIEVTGYVPDIRVHLEKARVAVCPVTVGAGIQNKVLEALAMARPVVATSKACQALSVRNGEHLLIADTPQEFADAVVRLLRDDGLAETLGRNGRRYVETYHNWDDKACQLLDAYQKAGATVPAG